MVLLNSPKYDQEMIMPDFRLKNIDNNYLISINGRDKTIKFRQFY